MTDQDLHAFCLQWQHWCKTRRLYIPPPLKTNLLGRMQPHMVGVAPDAALSADMAAFDLAVRALPDTSDKLAFLAFYRHRQRVPVKALARDMSISRKTFYKAVRRARADAYALAMRLKRAANESFDETD